MVTCMDCGGPGFNLSSCEGIEGVSTFNSCAARSIRWHTGVDLRRLVMSTFRKFNTSVFEFVGFVRKCATLRLFCPGGRLRTAPNGRSPRMLSVVPRAWGYLQHFSFKYQCCLSWISRAASKLVFLVFGTYDGVNILVCRESCLKSTAKSCVADEMAGREPVCRGVRSARAPRGLTARRC